MALLGPTLTVLDLHDNALEVLPDEIGQLDHLVKLNLNHNKLTALPKEFFGMKMLQGRTDGRRGRRVDRQDAFVVKLFEAVEVEISTDDVTSRHHWSDPYPDL